MLSNSEHLFNNNPGNIIGPRGTFRELEIGSIKEATAITYGEITCDSIAPAIAVRFAVSIANDSGDEQLSPLPRRPLEVTDFARYCAKSLAAR